MTDSVNTVLYIKSSFKFIGSDKHKDLALNCKYFLTHQFKHIFWVLKRTVSLRHTKYVLVEKIRKLIFWYTLLPKGLK